MKGLFQRVMDGMRPEVGEGAPLASEDDAQDDFRFPFDWENIPLIAGNHQRLMRGGDTSRWADPFEYAINRWGGKMPTSGMSALVIGCRRSPPVVDILFRSERFSRIVVVDDQEAPLMELARRGLKGVECVQANLERSDFPIGPFDFVASYDSLHRFANIDGIFNRIMDSLERGGMFVTREYVGPNRCQFTSSQLALANSMLRVLPQEMRRDTEGQVVKHQSAPPLHVMITNNSRRAVESERISALIKKHLKILEWVPLGGTLLAPLLAGIGGNFVTPTDEAQNYLQTLIDVEMKMIEGGLIDSDNVFVVARHPSV